MMNQLVPISSKSLSLSVDYFITKYTARFWRHKINIKNIMLKFPAGRRESKRLMSLEMFLRYLWKKFYHTEVNEHFTSRLRQLTFQLLIFVPFAVELLYTILVCAYIYMYIKSKETTSQHSVWGRRSLLEDMLLNHQGCQWGLFVLS